MNISIACGIKKHNIRLMFNGHSYNNANACCKEYRKKSTEKYIFSENFINMHKKYSEKSIKLLKYNLEIQNKKV